MNGEAPGIADICLIPVMCDARWFDFETGGFPLIG